MDGFPRMGVEITRGFISQHHIGVQYQCPRHCNALLLAAGKFTRPVVQPFAEPHFGQDSDGLFQQPRADQSS